MATLPPPRVVAYVDILGFTEKIGEIFEMDDGESFEGLLQTLQELATLSRATNQPSPSGFVRTAPKAHAFSDSIVVSDIADEGGAYHVVSTVALLTGRLLRRGLLCRGGIALGRTYHDDHIVLGEGLIRAYTLEHEAAFYPRIVVSDEVRPLVPDGPFLTLRQDSDRVWFVDVFYQLQRGRTADLSRGMTGLLGSPIEWDPDAFRDVRRLIITELSAPNARVSRLIKYRWLASKFNDAVREYVRGLVPEITGDGDPSSGFD